MSPIIVLKSISLLKSGSKAPDSLQIRAWVPSASRLAGLSCGPTIRELGRLDKCLQLICAVGPYGDFFVEILDFIYY